MGSTDDPDLSEAPAGRGPAERSLASGLDQVDRSAHETLGGTIVVPPEARSAARASAHRMLAAARDPRRAEAVLVLHYAADTVLSVAVDLAARPSVMRRLFERLEPATGLSRLSLAREVVLSPQLAAFAPAVAVEVVLGLLAGFADATGATIWDAEPDGTPGRRAAAGEWDTDEMSAVALAAKLLRGVPTGSRRGLTGRRLDEHLSPPAAVLLHGVGPTGDRGTGVLELGAPALEAILARSRNDGGESLAEQTMASAMQRRLARLRFDLHDGPQQEVHLLATDLAVFREQLLPIVRSDPHYEQIVGRLDDLAADLVALDGDLRRLASSVQSPFLPLGGLPVALRELAGAFAARTDIEPETKFEGDFSALTESQQITLLALIREALTNVREHAGASRVTISVSASPGGAAAEIVDDGCGFDPETTLVRAARDGHLGLVGMHERVRMLGGRTRIESRPGGPTMISAHLPSWPSETESESETCTET